jgi:DNA polymerase elongation subunit (family B)
MKMCRFSKLNYLTKKRQTNCELKMEGEEEFIKYPKENIIVQPYDWRRSETEDSARIDIYSLNQDSETCCLRVEGFDTYCYVELPLYRDGFPVKWDIPAIHKVKDWMERTLGADQLTGLNLTMRKKIYYHRGDLKYPMLRCEFKTERSMQYLVNLLNKEVNIEGFSKPLKFDIWEANARELSTVKKLLATNNLKHSKWINAFGYKVNDEEKLTSCKHEYVCSYKTLKAIDETISKSWATHPSKLYFDIEVNSANPRAFPSAFNAKDAIKVICAVYDDGRGNLIKVALVNGKCIPKDIKDDFDIFLYDNELDCINAFCELIAKYDPTIISGYNILGFDLPYLNVRLERCLQTWKPCSRLKNKVPTYYEMKWKSSAYGHQNLFVLELEGRLIIDLYPIIKRDEKLDNYTLDTVGKKFLGIGKTGMEPVEMFGIFLSGDEVRMKEVVEYCIRDTELVQKLFDKLSIWIGLVEMSNVMSVSINDLFTRGQQLRVISQIYDKVVGRGQVLAKRIIPGYKLQGAHVFEPKPGLYTNILVFDFSSLYPSIIRAYNISHDTLVPEGSNIPDSKCHIIEFDEDVEGTDDEKKRGVANRTVHRRYRFIKPLKGVTDRTFKFHECTHPDCLAKLIGDKTKPIEGHEQCTWHQGILPEIETELMTSRAETRAEMKGEKDPIVYNTLNKRQNAKKTSANSMYGALGVREGGRLTLPEGASSVTAMGRYLIRKVQEYVEKVRGGKVIYGDTDSVMVDMGITDPKQCHAIGDQLAKEITALFPPPLNMEFERVFGRFFLIRKKKYLAIPLKKDGSLDNDPKALITKGIILARRDNCKALRKIYRKVAVDIINGLPLKDTIYNVEQEIFGIMSRKYSVEDYVIIKSLGQKYKSKSNPLNIFSTQLRSIGKAVQPGDRLEYVLVKSEDPKALQGYRMRLSEPYVLAERLDKLSRSSDDPQVRKEFIPDYPEENVDYRFYVEKCIKNPIEQLIAIGYNEHFAANPVPIQSRCKAARINTFVGTKHIKSMLKFLDIKANYVKTLNLYGENLKNFLKPAPKAFFNLGGTDQTNAQPEFNIQPQTNAQPEFNIQPQFNVCFTPQELGSFNTSNLQPMFNFQPVTTC